MERERILSEQRDIHIRSLNLREPTGKCEMQTLLCMKRACSSNPTGCNQANQLTDQTRREKSWLCDKLDIRNRDQKNVQEIANKLKKFEEFALQRLKGIDN